MVFIVRCMRIFFIRINKRRKEREEKVGLG